MKIRTYSYQAHVYTYHGQDRLYNSSLKMMGLTKRRQPILDTYTCDYTSMPCGDKLKMSTTFGMDYNLIGLKSGTLNNLDSALDH